MVLVLFAILFVVGAGYVLINRDSNSSTTQKSNSSGTKEISANKFGEYFTNGKTAKCSYKEENEKSGTNGTYYFDNNRSYAELETTYAGQTSFMYQIYKDDVSYSWERGSKDGVLVKASNEELRKTFEESMAQADEQSREKAEQAAAAIKFECSDWDVDESKFTPPSDVSFKEVRL